MNVILVTQFIFISFGIIIATFGVATTTSKDREASMGLTATALGFVWIFQLSIMIYYFAAIYPAYAVPIK
jgi:hypothetical protein